MRSVCPYYAEVLTVKAVLCGSYYAKVVKLRRLYVSDPPVEGNYPVLGYILWAWQKQIPSGKRGGPAGLLERGVSEEEATSLPTLSIQPKGSISAPLRGRGIVVRRVLGFDSPPKTSSLWG